MAGIRWRIALAALLGTTGLALADENPMYQRDTGKWMRSPGATLAAPCFSDRSVLHDSLLRPTSQDVVVTPSTNGNAVNGNGLGDEPKHISDNSFFIEEAYNQEPGVVQHIFNWVGLWAESGGRRRDSYLAATMELPIHSQTHQFSFTLPYLSFFDEAAFGGPEEQGGLGDIQLNYRYQLLMETDDQPAVAPRLSVILPTGDEGRGLGSGEPGYQFNLPISKQMEPFAFHFNAGFTYTPDVTVTLPIGLSSAERDLRAYNLGFSAIYLASYDLNFLFELVAFWNEDVDDFGFRDKSTEIYFNPGLRYAIYTKDELQWVIGIGVPIGLSRDAADIGIFGYMSVEHAFREMEK